jgi:hypothetical protein
MRRKLMPATARTAARGAVLKELRCRELPPVALIGNLANRMMFSDGEIKEAIWQLLAETRIEFTSAQTLKLVRPGRRYSAAACRSRG